MNKSDCYELKINGPSKEQTAAVCGHITSRFDASVIPARSLDEGRRQTLRVPLQDKDFGSHIKELRASLREIGVRTAPEVCLKPLPTLVSFTL
jgi:hypothetical protein